MIKLECFWKSFLSSVCPGTVSMGDELSKEVGVGMSEKEMLKISVEEFTRVQKYMLLIQDKESAAYKEIKDRYIELKVILTASGINITELDKIKE